jgi:hypothetical protein
MYIYFMSTVICIEQYWLYYYANVFGAKIHLKIMFIVYIVKYDLPSLNVLIAIIFTQ